MKITNYQIDDLIAKEKNDQILEQMKYTGGIRGIRALRKLKKEPENVKDKIGYLN
jgi:hypothetical protein